MLKLNLEGLINWVEVKKVSGSFYSDDRVIAKRVRVDKGEVTKIDGEIKKDDTFTINNEEDYEFK